MEILKGMEFFIIQINKLHMKVNGNKINLTETESYITKSHKIQILLIIRTSNK